MFVIKQGASNSAKLVDPSNNLSEALIAIRQRDGEEIANFRFEQSSPQGA
jgi:hypothetical protein